MSKDRASDIPVLRSTALSATQKIVATRLVQSQHVAASVTAFAEADAGMLLAAAAAMGGNDRRVTITHLLIKAVALCLVRHPRLNAALVDDRIIEYATVNISTAVALESGELQLVVIRDAQRKSVVEIAEELGELAARARTHSLSLKDVRGGTFTLSNYGQLRRVIWSTPILTPAQAATLGVGRSRTLPLAICERSAAQHAVRPILPLSLTYDHRIVNGVPAGQFMDDLAELIESEKTYQ